MNVTFAPRGILQIEDARIVYRNFKGEGSQFNREGDKNFSLVIPDQELADRLTDEGWNIKIKPPRDEGDVPFIVLPVKLKFNERGPVCYLRSNGNLIKLDEEGVACFDDIDIDYIEMDIRPYHWDVNGKQGVTAYLDCICVTQRLDRFAAKYSNQD